MIRKNIERKSVIGIKIEKIEGKTVRGRGREMQRRIVIEDGTRRG